MFSTVTGQQVKEEHLPAQYWVHQAKIILSNRMHMGRVIRILDVQLSSKDAIGIKKTPSGLSSPDGNTPLWKTARSSTPGAYVFYCHRAPSQRGNRMHMGRVIRILDVQLSSKDAIGIKKTPEAVNHSVGAMMAVGLGASQLQPYLDSVKGKNTGELIIACHNR
jgi:hypothetical protein